MLCDAVLVMLCDAVLVLYNAIPMLCDAVKKRGMDLRAQFRRRLNDPVCPAVGDRSHERPRRQILLRYVMLSYVMLCCVMYVTVEEQCCEKLTYKGNKQAHVTGKTTVSGKCKNSIRTVQ
jgi:hypothetical protein